MSNASIGKLGTGVLPPAQTRADIAGVVQQVIDEEFGPDPRLCFWLAAVGSRVASRIVGYQYLLHAGTLRIEAIRTKKYVDYYEMGPQGEGRQRGEFHCWSSAKHRRGRIELVELSARSYAWWLRHRFTEVPTADLPPYVWDWGERIPTRIKLITDIEATAQFRATELEHGTRIETLATEALHRLGASENHFPMAVSVGNPYLALPKAGRNDPCGCGSGKKYKKCCLGLEPVAGAA